MNTEPANTAAEPPARDTTEPPAIATVMRRVAGAGDVLAAVCLGIIVVGICAMVLLRDLFKLGVVWIDEIVRYLQIWLVYSAAVGLVVRGEHIAMDAIYLRVPARLRRGLRIVYGVAIVAFSGFMAWAGWQQAAIVLRSSETSASGALPAILGYASIPVGFFLMTIAGLYYVWFRAPGEDAESWTPQ